MSRAKARRPGRRTSLRIMAMAMALSVSPGMGQVAPAQPPASAPASSPPASAPAIPPPTASQPSTSAQPPGTTPEPPKAAEAPFGEIREIEARPAIRTKGQSPWDNGFEALKAAVAALDGEAKRLNLPRNGHPIVYFTDSDDTGFTYEAMAPLAAAPPTGTAFGKDFDSVMSPAGRAVVFSHEGAYDDIDTAYEALAAWLDDKGLVSTGKFVEEYEFIPERSEETTLKLKIVVFLK